MLRYEPLPGFEGITLSGSYLTLRELYSLLHDVNERSAVIRDKEAGLMELAYDVRKAYEGRREVIKPPEYMPEAGTRFGVALLWPQVLVQARILRVSLAYMDHGPSHQAFTYALEAVLHDALDDVFASDADKIKGAWQMIDPATPATEERLESRSAAFRSWSGVRRKASLAGLLKSFHPLYEELPSMWENMESHLHPSNLAAARF